MNSKQISYSERSGLILAQTAQECVRSIRVGATPKQIDEIIYTYITSQNAIPSFLGFEGYTYSSCISVNNVLVHGLPTQIPFEDGDIVSIDLGVNYNGFHTDGAFTTHIGTVEKHILKAIKVTREALYKGIDASIPGNRIGDISYAIQKVADRHSLCVIRELSGHGIGMNLHEKPSIPNYGKPGIGAILQPGMCIAIEPMFAVPASATAPQCVGCPISISRDGWSVMLDQKLMGIHFEHTIRITQSKPIILTRLVDSKNQVW